MAYRVMDDSPPIHSVPLPDGDVGTRKTLAEMRRLSDDGSRDTLVRAVALRAVREAGDHNPIGQVRAWFEWVRDAIFFLNDPVATEWLQAPRYTIQFGAGDCDDRATLLAAGLKAIGVPAEFAVVAVDPRAPHSFSHVYVVAIVNGRRVKLDPTYRTNTIGSAPPAFRTWMVPA